MKTSFLNTRIFIAPLFLVLFHCYVAFAQTAAEADAPKDEKAAVLMAVSQLNQAMVDRDKATLELITMEELSYGHSGGKIETKKAFIDDIVQGDFDFIATDTENQTVFFFWRRYRCGTAYFPDRSDQQGRKGKYPDWQYDGF